MATIGFDLDSVLADTHGACVEGLRAAGKIPYDTVCEGTYELEYNEKTGTGFPGVVYQDLVDLFMNPEFWRGIPPIEEGVSLINDLYLGGHATCVITDRRWYDELEQETDQYLYDSEVLFGELVIAKASEKGEVCRRRGVEYFVDDQEKNVRVAAPHVKRGYLVAYPWNEGAELPENCMRGSLAEIRADLMGRLVGCAV